MRQLHNFKWPKEYRIEQKNTKILVIKWKKIDKFRKAAKEVKPK